MDDARLIRIETKVDELHGKLDTHLQLATKNDTSIGWLKWIVGGAWLAIAGMFAAK